MLAVAEMGAAFEQLAHGKFWQSHEFSLLYRLARRGDYLLKRHRTATAEHLPKAIPACEMAGLIGSYPLLGKGFGVPEPR